MKMEICSQMLFCAPTTTHINIIHLKSPGMNERVVLCTMTVKYCIKIELIVSSFEFTNIKIQIDNQ